MLTSSSLERILWALQLKRISPVARLLAIFMANEGGLVNEEFWAERADSDDPEWFVVVHDAAEWIGCHPDQIANALIDLMRVGVRVAPLRAGNIYFRFPWEPPAADAPNVRSVSERTISIYVISAGAASKIGISVEPANRLLGLQGANPLMRLSLEFHAAGPSSRIRAVERESHARLAHAAIGNEWFAVSPTQAIEVVKAVLAERGKE